MALRRPTASATCRATRRAPTAATTSTTRSRSSVPVWDVAGGQGANGWYHIVGFAGMQLTACNGGKDIEGVLRQLILPGPDDDRLHSRRARRWACSSSTSAVGPPAGGRHKPGPPDPDGGRSGNGRCPPTGDGQPECRSLHPRRGSLDSWSTRPRGSDHRLGRRNRRAMQPRTVSRDSARMVGLTTSAHDHERRSGAALTIASPVRSTAAAALRGRSGQARRAQPPRAEPGRARAHRADRHAALADGRRPRSDLLRADHRRERRSCRCPRGGDQQLVDLRGRRRLQCDHELAHVRERRGRPSGSRSPSPRPTWP